MKTHILCNIIEFSVIALFGFDNIANAQGNANISINQWFGNGESYTDLFDVSQGVTIVSTSSVYPGWDARSAIGYHNANTIEPDNFYFADNEPAGTVDFINFKTAIPVFISGFNLRTYDDSYIPGNPNRGVTRFSLLCSSDSGQTYSLLATANLQNSYKDNYGYWGILISASFAPVTSQYFRIEAVRYNTTAPRIVELDAVGHIAIVGNMSFEGIIPSAAAQNVTFTIRPTDGSADITQVLAVPTSGAFNLSDLPQKAYILHIKADKYLTANVSVDATNGNVSGVTATLGAGDANNDNVVNTADFNTLINAFGGTGYDPNTGYDPKADFNGDGNVDTADFNLLVGNFGSSGDP